MFLKQSCHAISLFLLNQHYTDGVNKPLLKSYFVGTQKNGVTSTVTPFYALTAGQIISYVC